MERFGRFGWGMVVAAVLLSVAAAAVAYNAGVSDGLAGATVATATQAPQVVYRHLHWGGGGWMSPLLVLMIWIVVIRGICWRRSWYYGGPYGRWRGPYGGWRDDGPWGPPAAFDEWHRQAHEHMKETPSADDPGRRG